eukprot:CAMPEP_0196999320 /NCGR_PEP_ID=MMETSP1380-20130617/4542_1 /TAXON_ID=5936 /ORGANISM="Euplotes crassus, Strain CT5" /LENGTH=290 /DNA_ID=CAMNT_0042416225 /DNA_START=85 /DNA_END=956 /DNA_ORIENTATION=+
MSSKKELDLTGFKIFSIISSKIQESSEGWYTSVGKMSMIWEDSKNAALQMIRGIRILCQWSSDGNLLSDVSTTECTEEYFSQFKPYLASFGNKVLDELNIQQAYFEEELTPERFDFFDSAKRNSEVQTLRAGHYITILIMIFLITSVIVSTIIELIERSKKTAREKAGIPEPEPKPKNCLQKYFTSFYLLENTSKLFFARSKDGDKNLEILNGVRVLSMAWVILGHTYYYAMRTALHNPLVPLDLLKSFTFNIVSSGPYSVDIFFWLSGFLGVYILLGSTHKRKGRMQNW